MTFEAIPGLLADLLQEQRGTREAITSLAEAIAGIRAKSVDTLSTKPVAAQATTAPTAEVPVPNAAVAPTAESASEPPSYQTVANVVTQLSKLKGRNTALELLQTFGVNRNQGAESTLAYWVSHLVVLKALEYEYSPETMTYKEELLK